LFKSKSRRSRSSSNVTAFEECPTTPPPLPPTTVDRSPGKKSSNKKEKEVTVSNKNGKEVKEEYPTTPPPLPPTTVDRSPGKKSSNKKEKEVTVSNKNDKEVKVLTIMVQALAVKLKKREKQVLKLQEKSNKLDEISLLLESAEERIVDAAAENQALNRKVQCLQSTIDLQDVEENNRWNQRDAQTKTTADTAAAAATAANTKRTSTEEFHQVVLARDMALLRAGEMSIDLAESRAETDELRDELAAITNALQAQKSAADGSSSSSDSVSSPISPTSVAVPEFPIRSLQDSMKDLTNLWDSGKTLMTRSRVPSTSEPERA
jgi:hypothetical protein